MGLKNTFSANKITEKDKENIGVTVRIVGSAIIKWSAQRGTRDGPATDSPGWAPDV